MPDTPIAYFLTVHAYGTRLPGDENGWVHPRQNRYATPLPAPNCALRRSAAARMRHEPFILDEAARGVVLRTIRDVLAIGAGVSMSPTPERLIGTSS